MSQGSRGRKKLYYKIGEACKLLDIQPYVLRYWETEFPSLSPDKSKSGQRVYNDKDLATIRRIKELLYEEGYTIAGAKKKLEGELEAADESAGQDAAAEAAAQAPAGAQEPRLDTPTDEQVKLRRGIRRALEEARELLELLAARAPEE